MTSEALSSKIAERMLKSSCENDDDASEATKSTNKESFRERRLTYLGGTKLNIDIDFDEDEDEDEDEDDGGISKDIPITTKLNNIKAVEACVKLDENKFDDSESEDLESNPEPDVTHIDKKIKLNEKPPSPLPVKESAMRHVSSTGVDGRFQANQITLIQEPDKEAYVAVLRKDGSKIDYIPDDHRPFSKNAVGSFSCHGVEPAYIVNNETGEVDEDNAMTLPLAKINQDRGEIVVPFGNEPKTALFAVYDGHGMKGERVAQFVMKELPHRLHAHEKFNEDIEVAFKDSFEVVDKALKSQPRTQPMYSGTTACVALLRNQKLIVSNVGDSRAVLARRKKIVQGEHESKYIAIDLSKDHTLNSPEESHRIRSSGGFISAHPDDANNYRVWLDSSCKQIGLAMSRSIGDHILRPAGVIPIPTVTMRDLCEDDEFMIIATDGVWEFIDSDQAVNIVAESFENGSRDASEACKNLIETAASNWYEHEGDYRDDITALIVKVNKLWESC